MSIIVVRLWSLSQRFQKLNIFFCKILANLRLMSLLKESHKSLDLTFYYKRGIKMKSFLTISAFFTIFMVSSNRVCKIIRNCFMKRKLYLKVTQHCNFWTRVPKLVILKARIDCKSFLYPLSLWEPNDLKQRFWQEK